MAKRHWITTTLIVLMLSGAGACLYFQRSMHMDLEQLDSAYKAARTDAQRLQQELSQAQKLLGERNTSTAKLRARLNKTESSLTSAVIKLESLRNEIETQQNHINELQTELFTTRKQVRARADEVARSQARSEHLNTLLAQSNNRISTLLTNQKELEHALAQAGKQLEKSRARTAGLAITRTELITSLTAAKEEQSDAANKADTLKTELEATRIALKKTQRQLTENKRILEQVAEEKRSAASQYRQARAQLALQQSQSRNARETIKQLEDRLQQEQAAMDNLQNRLQALSNEKQTLVSRLEDGTTVIKLPENIVFDSGSAQIGKAGRQTLKFLATALQSFPNHLISIQGHSDSRPISLKLQNRYPTNWELSAARAASAVRVLRDNNIAPSRMQAVGFADTRPLVEETGSDSRRTNRRIEVLLFPDQFNVKTYPAVTSPIPYPLSPKRRPCETQRSTPSKPFHKYGNQSSPPAT